MKYDKNCINYLHLDREADSLDQQSSHHLYDHLMGLISQLYQTGDVDEIQYHLEEMLYIFGESLPKEELKIQKKPTPEEEYKDKFLKSYVGYTRAYAEMMSTAKTRK